MFENSPECSSSSFLNSDCHSMQAVLSDFIQWGVLLLSEKQTALKRVEGKIGTRVQFSKRKSKLES